MKFLIDAQLSYKLSKFLSKRGYDVIHVTLLPKKDYTPDIEIMQYSDKQSRILITKDSDFVDSFIIKKSPHKLLFISIGNIGNDELFKIVDKNFETIYQLFEHYNYIELSINKLIVHE
jgi:predicted nuclease of predicted toxin-antitoxin system